MDAQTTPPDTQRTGSKNPFTEMWDVIDEMKRCCDAVPESDTTGKLRGKIGRLESTLREAQENEDLTSLRADAQSTEDLVRRVQENDPLTRLLRCVARLNQRIALQP